MIEIVKTINGVKKLVPLTTDSGQGLPLGAITAFYGTTPPNGYLLCDGSEFSSTDYPALYTFLGDNHTPDLRGEFLRGAGTNSHSGQGSGGSVGTHQDATAVPNAFVNGAKYPVGPLATEITNADSAKGSAVAIATMQGYSDVAIDAAYTVRPTNTSVNYIIKAVIGPIEDSSADQVVQNINNSRSYSTEEVNTGKTWIDGKPIYRKVMPMFADTETVAHSLVHSTVYTIPNIDVTEWKQLIDGKILCTSGNGGDNSDMLLGQLRLNGSSNSWTSLIWTQNTNYNNCMKLYVVAEYTKTTD